MRDLDNRDDDGAPWEVTDEPEKLIPYLDGPVRRDLTDPANESELDALIDAFKRHDLSVVQEAGRAFGIYVSEAGDDS